MGSRKMSEDSSPEFLTPRNVMKIRKFTFDFFNNIRWRKPPNNELTHYIHSITFDYNPNKSTLLILTWAPGIIVGHKKRRLGLLKKKMNEEFGFSGNGLWEKTRPFSIKVENIPTPDFEERKELFTVLHDFFE